MNEQLSMTNLTGLLVLTVVALLAPSPALSAERRFTLDPDRSMVLVRTGRAGLFKFAGHEHVVRARQLEGHIVADDANLAASSVSVVIPAAGLTVLFEGEPPQDVPKVQAKMQSPDLLDVTRYPTITFRSTAVTAKAAGEGIYEATIAGELVLHGVTRRMTMPARVELAAGTLVAKGRTTLRQTDFSLEPTSVAGVVKVKNEVVIEYEFVAKEASF
jgi:polyisoprenoid-binding protein YceI